MARRPLTFDPSLEDVFVGDSDPRLSKLSVDARILKYGKNGPSIPTRDLTERERAAIRKIGSPRRKPS